MNKGEKTIAIVVPIAVAIIGGIFTLIPGIIQDDASTEEPIDLQKLENPTAVISGPRTVTTNTLVTFTADKSNDTDGFIDNYQWYVNGDKISEQSFLEHSFETKGTFQIDLVVFDDDKLSGKDTMTIQVLDPDRDEIGDYENPEGSTYTIYPDDTRIVVGTFRNYGMVDNQGILWFKGWGELEKGRMINNGLINNTGIMKFEHAGFDNHDDVKNYDIVVTDFYFNNRDNFENFGNIELTKEATFQNTGNFENSGIMTVECTTSVSGNEVIGTPLSDNCTNPDIP